MKTSLQGIGLIEDSEDFRSAPYICPAGVPTIGIGTTVYPNGVAVTMQDKKIDYGTALKILMLQLVTYEDGVKRYVRVPISQGQFDALVDFAYNLGLDALRNSTLLRLLNASDYYGASQQFKRWVYADGKKQNGLVIRRERERKLFLT